MRVHFFYICNISTSDFYIHVIFIENQRVIFNDRM